MACAGLDGLPLNIVVVPFPTRAPELNPIEPCWNTFVKRLKMLKVRVLNGAGGAWALKEAACDVLNKFSHEDIKKIISVKDIMVIETNYISIVNYK